MKYHYEGSTAQIGTEDWTEPCDAFASTPEIAAQQVVEWSLKCGVIESSEAVNICVRQIAINGEPLGEWEYFTGKAFVTYRSEISAQNPLATPENKP